MARLTKQEILGAKLAEKEVEIQSLGGSVLLREMTLAQQDAITKSATLGMKADGTPEMDTLGFQVKIVMETCIEPKFEAEDFESMQKVASRAWTEIRNACYKINGLMATLEDAEKN